MIWVSQFLIYPLTLFIVLYVVKFIIFFYFYGFWILSHKDLLHCNIRKKLLMLSPNTYMLSLFSMHTFDSFEIYLIFIRAWCEVQIQHLFPYLFYHHLLMCLSFLQGFEMLSFSYIELKYAFGITFVLSTICCW